MVVFFTSEFSRALSDMDSDGRLGCEEFVLAMHLCEQAQLGHPPPAKLPLDLIPPSFRRNARTASVSSQGSGTADQDPASSLLQSKNLLISFFNHLITQGTKVFLIYSLLKFIFLYI